MSEIPLARRENLIVQDLSDEILIYDEQEHRVSHLKPTDAFVWRHCDGRTSKEAVLLLLKKEFEVAGGEEFLTVTLKRLEKLSLLQKPAVYRARAQVA